MIKEPYKIVVLGGLRSGKTTLLQTLVASKSADEHGPYTFYLKDIEVDNVKHKIEFVDTQGCEEHAPRMANDVTNADGIIMVFGLNCRQSFLGGKRLLRQVWEYKDKQQFPLVVVGNKADIPEEREVYRDDGVNLARAWKAPYKEISALNTAQVIDVFVELVRNIITPPQAPVPPTPPVKPKTKFFKRIFKK